MADAQATALFKVNADVSGAVKSLDKMGAAWGRVGEATKKSQGGFDKFLDSAFTGLTKFNFAMEGVQKILSGTMKALDSAAAYERRKAWENMLPAGAVDKFSAATGSLINRQDVLRVSVKGMTGDFKLSEREMQTTLQAALALEQRGFGPAAETADKLVDALSKGVNKLDDFGINLEKTNDRQGDVNRAMEKFGEIAANIQTDDAVAKVYRLRDAMRSLGQRAEDAGNYLVSGWAEAYADAEEYIGGEMAGDIAGGESLGAGQLMPFIRKQEALYGYSRGGAGIYPKGRKRGGIAGGSVEEAMARQAMLDKEGRDLTAKYEAARAEEAARANLLDRERRAAMDRYTSGLGPYEGTLGTGYGVGGAGDVALSGRRGGGPIQAGQGYRSDIEATKKREQLVSDLGDTSTAIGATYATLAGGITAAVDAAITSSDSIGKAAAKASASVLKSLAVESAGRAIYEGALAVGSIAIGDPKGAALHGLAAGKFALAAAATGALAAGLGQVAGGSGGGYSAGASAGPAGGGYSPGRGSDGSRGGGGETYNFIFGDGFYGDTQGIANAVAGAMRNHQRKGGRGNFNASFGG